MYSGALSKGRWHYTCTASLAECIIEHPQPLPVSGQGQDDALCAARLCKCHCNMHAAARARGCAASTRVLQTLQSWQSPGTRSGNQRLCCRRWEGSSDHTRTVVWHAGLKARNGCFSLSSRFGTSKPAREPSPLNISRQGPRGVGNYAAVQRAARLHSGCKGAGHPRQREAAYLARVRDGASALVQQLVQSRDLAGLPTSDGDGRCQQVLIHPCSPLHALDQPSKVGGGKLAQFFSMQG